MQIEKVQHCWISRPGSLGTTNVTFLQHCRKTRARWCSTTILHLITLNSHFSSQPAREQFPPSGEFRWAAASITLNQLFHRSCDLLSTHWSRYNNTAWACICVTPLFISASPRGRRCTRREVQFPKHPSNHGCLWRVLVSICHRKFPVQVFKMRYLIIIYLERSMRAFQEYSS